MLKLKIGSLTPSLVIAASISSMGLTGCSAGFTGASSASTTNAAASAPTSGSTAANTTWSNFSMNGSASGGQFGGVQVVKLDTVNKLLIVTLPVPANPYLANGVGVDVPITKLPGADLALQPSSSGGSQFVLTIPLADIVKGVNFPAAQKLPSGDPLPAIPAGQLPAFAVQIPNISNVSTTIYLDTSIVALYVSTTFNPMIGLTFPIMSDDGTRTLGYISTVPAKGTVNGGFFLSVQFPDDIARFIDNNI